MEFFITFGIVTALLGIFMLVFWIMMLVHAIQNHIESKALWIIIILMFSFLGSVVYYFAVKRKFDAEHNKNVVTATPIAPEQTTQQ